MPPLGLSAQLACILEVTARKPGNVHREQDFPGLTYTDFLMSAAAIAPEIEVANSRAIGETILASVCATRRVVNTNTNLGIVLLLTPLAASVPGGWGGVFDAPVEVPASSQGTGASQSLRPSHPAVELDWPLSVRAFVASLTVADASNAYAAIRLAQPGGLRRVVDQDVADEPTVTLREAMQLAADRDLIAQQYVNGFADVFAGADFLRDHLANGLECAIMDLQRHFFSEHLDSLIVRKRGIKEANELRERARSGEQLEPWFAAAFPHRNPGTTADLICASLFVGLRTGSIPVPVQL